VQVIDRLHSFARRLAQLPPRPPQPTQEARWAPEQAGVESAAMWAAEVASCPSDRQLEVLAALVHHAGGAKVAAHCLGITARTVKAHLAGARARTGSETTVQLVAWCDDNVPRWRERRPAA
jgi:DNA-binding CsgD family transcriptional regulator